MGVAEAEKQELMLALYIFMTFGVFTEYRSYCLEDFHISVLNWEELGKSIMNSALLVHENQSQHPSNGRLLTPTLTLHCKPIRADKNHKIHTST